MPRKIRRGSRRPEGHIPVGQIVGPFGLDGRMKVAMQTDFPERFKKGATLFINGDPFKVISCGFHKDQARIKVEGVTTVEMAEDLRWAEVTVPNSDRPHLDKDEYYVQDLVGMEAVLTTGQVIGFVDEVIAAPAQDLLRIGETLVPMVRAFVRSVDLEKKLITLDLIPGMLPGEDSVEAR